jgi:hypothetical protein
VAQDDVRRRTPLAYVEPIATALDAQAALARALDRFAPGEQRLLDLQQHYELLTLADSRRAEDLTLRSDRADDFEALLRALHHAEHEFEHLVGPTFPPLTGETRTLTVLILPHRAAYQEYLHAFTSFAVENDGLYDELSATIYTYRRSATQSAHSLEQSLRHEYAHHLTAHRLFPGHWRSPDYHEQPRGWLDEGIAELIAGVSHLDTICADTELRPLAELLATRAGYDRFGTFDYPYAWALIKFFAEERPEVLRRILTAYRDGSYRLDHFAHIAGTSLAEAEAAWHTSIRVWCATGRGSITHS